MVQPIHPPVDQATGPATRPTGRGRFVVAPDRSALLVEARSSVGRIVFGTNSLSGYVEADVHDGVFATDPAPTGMLMVELGTLTSGNTLYDAELSRRLDTRRYPTSTIELRDSTEGADHRYRLSADITLHGVTRSIDGTLSASVEEGGDVLLTGEHVVDIRDFDLKRPTVLMLQIFPDVRVHLQLVVQVH
jgi:polyisoprenoid-binding protein YceI